jgi:hypothetical protein
MSEDNTKVTDLSTEQQKAIIDTKEVLASKQDVLMAIGQIQAFDNVRKYVTVTEIITFKRVKESKQYKGLVYTDVNGKSVTVTDLKEVCSVFFNRSYEQMQEDLKNLETFGSDFLESSQQMGLGYRELRKLRQLPTEEQSLIINNEAVNFGDKEALKSAIEDYTFAHVTEKAELTKKIDEVKTNLDVAREMSAEKQIKLDQHAEEEAKRRLSQAPWHRDSLDMVDAMIEARAFITQGTNQLLDVLNNLSTNHELDSKAIDLIGRSLLSEAKYNFDLVNEMANEMFGILGGKYHPDLYADDLFTQLHSYNPNEEINSEEVTSAE